MANTKLNIDFSCETSVDHYFKSSFARSVVSDSACKTKSLDYYMNISKDANIARELNSRPNKDFFQSQKKPSYSSENVDSSLRSEKLWKSSKEDIRRSHSAMDESQTRPRNDMTKLIDTAVLQSQVETLQWQLKQTESSRQMYRAVMEQVVKFLERAHKSLDMMVQKTGLDGSSSGKYRVPRSRSVHTVDVSPTRTIPESKAHYVPRVKSVAHFEESKNYSAFRDFTWRRPKKTVPDPDEIPPEKLSQEAFRLLRTAQSLLNTREPDLTHRISNGTTDENSIHSNYVSMQDMNYLSNGMNHRSSTPRSHITSICSERDSSPSPEVRSIQGSIYSLSLLNSPSKRSSRSSASLSNGTSSELLALSRSKQNNIEETASQSVGSCTSLYQESLNRSGFSKPPDVPDTIASYRNESEKIYSSCVRSSSLHSKDKITNLTTNCSPSFQLCASDSHDVKFTNKQLSVSSNEDESGFSSMSSFQEVGVPISLTSGTVQSYPELGLPVVDLPISNQNGISHHRWRSSPVEIHPKLNNQLGTYENSKEALHVLWV